MAESVLTYLVQKNQIEGWKIDSAGTSDEERGNPPHPGTCAKLKKEGIPVVPHRAREITSYDYDIYDMIVYMDEQNKRALLNRFRGDPEHKLHALLEFAPASYTCGRTDVDDPWWTGNFDITYEDIMQGCKAILTL